MLNIQTTLIIILLISIIIKAILQEKKSKAEKNYFINVLKHNLEICTLAQKQGMHLLLTEGAKTDLQKELFSSLLNSCKYNLDIISTLLNTLKFEKDIPYKMMEQITLDSFNLLCSDTLTELIKEKNIKLIYKCQNYQIYTNKYHLQCIFSNILYLVLMYSYKNTELDITINHDGKNLKTIITYYGNSFAKDKNLYKLNDYMAIGCSIKMYYCKKIINFYGGKVNLANLSDNKVSLSIVLPLKCQNIQALDEKSRVHIMKNISFCK